MIQNFDYYHRHEVPFLILCNPDGSEIASIGNAIDKILTLKYNALSELSFTIPNKMEDGTFSSSYSLIKSKKLIYVKDVGFFRINDIEESIDGLVKIKKVICNSIDSEMVQKRIVGFKGTVKLYDPLDDGTPNSSHKSLMGYILHNIIPNWSLDSIDSPLLSLYRTFDINDSSLYSFLTVDVENAFGCIFEFDYFSRTIKIIEKSNAIYPTDIYLSYDNVIKQLNIKEISSEITTCLHVYGGGSLSIAAVNPLGGTAIYNFDYYKTTEWMSQELINAINSWESKIDYWYNKPVDGYGDKLTDAKNVNAGIITKNGELTDLESQYSALDLERKQKIEQGLDITSITAQLDDLSQQILDKKLEISNYTAMLNGILDELKAINQTLSLTNTNNFSIELQSQLNNFIIENTYQNENFVQTSIMDNVEIQNIEEDLYNQAKNNVLPDLSQPRYEFSIDSINFVFLEEFKTLIESLQLGSIVTIELDDDKNTITTYLLEIKINYDDPNDFSLTFSNRLRLSNEGFIYSELFGEGVKASSSVGYSKINWGDWRDNWKDDVSSFITSALNTTKNKLINSNNEEITITNSGLHGKKIISEANKTYSPKQVWLTSSILAFTDNAWSKAKMALGEITVKGVSQYGLVADVIVGKLLAGNALTITNEKSNFILDENGAELYNAKFSIDSSKTNITISPLSTVINGLTNNPGITIQTNVGGTWKKTFYADSLGNINFSGNLSGATGSFTGNITALSGTIGGISLGTLPTGIPGGGTGIFLDTTHYLNKNGDLTWGALSIVGSNAEFNGTIHAQKLFGLLQGNQIGQGQINNGHISELSADKIKAGTMSADRIYGGTISWASGTLGSDEPSGYLFMRGKTNLQIRVGTTGTGKFPVTSAMWTNDSNDGFWFVECGASPDSSGLSLYPLYTYLRTEELKVRTSTLEGSGWTGVVSGITTIDGNKDFSFINGILVDVIAV